MVSPSGWTWKTYQPVRSQQILTIIGAILSYLFPGSDWHAAIGTGLHHCKALIAVITKKYTLSRYCKR